MRHGTTAAVLAADDLWLVDLISFATLRGEARAALKQALPQLKRFC